MCEPKSSNIIDLMKQPRKQSKKTHRLIQEAYKKKVLAK